MEKLSEETSVLNLSMYIAWTIGYWIDKPLLCTISLAGIAISMLLSLKIVFATIKEKDKEEKIKGVKRLVNRSVFYICFIAMYFITLK